MFAVKRFKHYFIYLKVQLINFTWRDDTQWGNRTIIIIIIIMIIIIIITTIIIILTIY